MRKQHRGKADAAKEALMSKYRSLGILFSLSVFLLNACSGELNFEEAKDVLSKQRGAIKVSLPSPEGRFVKYKDDNNTIYDKLAAEGYVEIIEDAERPSESEYDRRVYYRIRLTDKLSPYMVDKSYIKIGELEVAEIRGIKRVPADERLRVVEFTTRFVQNPIGEVISLKNRNLGIEETKCIFEKKHFGGWKLSLMPPDFASRFESLRADMYPVLAAKPAGSSPGAGESARASAKEPGVAIVADGQPGGDKDRNNGGAGSDEVFSVENAEKICHNAVLSIAIPVPKMDGTTTVYYVKTADRTALLPYKDKFKRYGHRFCFRVRGVAPGVQIGLSASILCSIYKVGEKWQYEVNDDWQEGCNFTQ